MHSIAHSGLTDCQPTVFRPHTAQAGWTDKIRDLIRRWRARAQDRRSYARMTERDFQDLRWNRWEIEHELARPFWRD